MLVVLSWCYRPPGSKEAEEDSCQWPLVWVGAHKHGLSEHPIRLANWTQDLEKQSCSLCDLGYCACSAGLGKAVISESATKAFA